MQERKREERGQRVTANCVNSPGTYLSGLHRDDRVAKLLGPRTHHICHWLLASFLQMSPEIIYSTHNIVQWYISSVCVHVRACVCV